MRAPGWRTKRPICRRGCRVLAVAAAVQVVEEVVEKEEVEVVVMMINSHSLDPVRRDNWVIAHLGREC
jgi:hypothetical protein